MSAHKILTTRDIDVVYDNDQDRIILNFCDKRGHSIHKLKLEREVQNICYIDGSKFAFTLEERNDVYICDPKEKTIQSRTLDWPTRALVAGKYLIVNLEKNFDEHVLSILDPNNLTEKNCILVGKVDTMCTSGNDLFCNIFENDHCQIKMYDIETGVLVRDIGEPRPPTKKKAIMGSLRNGNIFLAVTIIKANFGIYVYSSITGLQINLIAIKYRSTHVHIFTFVPFVCSLPCGDLAIAYRENEKKGSPDEKEWQTVEVYKPLEQKSTMKITKIDKDLSLRSQEEMHDFIAQKKRISALVTLNLFPNNIIETIVDYASPRLALKKCK